MKKSTKSKFGRGAGIGVTFAVLAVVVVAGFQNGNMMNLHGAPLNGDEKRLSEITPFAGESKKTSENFDHYGNLCGAKVEWVGHEVSEDAVKAIGNPYRILPPGSMVTMDHNPERINVHINADGLVLDVKCG